MMKLELLAEPITTLREKTKLTDDKKFYMVWYGIINSLVLLSFIGMAGQRCTGLASAQVCISVPFGAMGPLCNLLSLLCYAPALFFLHTHFSAPASPSEEDAAAAASQDDDASKVPPRPQMAIAKEAALAQLAHQRTEDAGPGELYPLHTDLVSFDHFGTDISQYMHFMYSWTR